MAVKNHRAPIPSTRVKYVDDLTLAESINLKQRLILNTNPTLPPSFHCRTGHLLATSKLQDQLDELLDYTNVNLMKLNEKKSKVMILNPAHTLDFPPRLTFNGIDFMEVIDAIKLVGIMITSDLKWRKNTANLVKKGMGKIWMIRRLKNIGATTEELLEVYKLQVRSTLELAAPVWHSGITGEESDDLERVQKIAFRIILGENYCSYDIAVTTLEEELLSTRREGQCMKFARKLSIDPRFKDKFCKPHERDTRAEPTPFMEQRTRTARFYKSPIPYFTRLLNRQSL